MELDRYRGDSQNTRRIVVCMMYPKEKWTYSTRLLLIHIAYKIYLLHSVTYYCRCGNWNTM